MHLFFESQHFLTSMFVYSLGCIQIIDEVTNLLLSKLFCARLSMFRSASSLSSKYSFLIDPNNWSIAVILADSRKKKEHFFTESMWNEQQSLCSK